MISRRALPLLVVLGWAALASAAGGAAFEADLAWQEAHASGDLQIVGAAWAWNIVPPRAAGDEPLLDAYLQIEGQELVVTEQFKDYKGVSQVGNFEPRDEPLQTKQTPIEGGSLRLVVARADLRMLGAPISDSANPVIMEVRSDFLALRHLETIRVSLFSGAESSNFRMERSVERDEAAVTFAAPSAADLVEARGDFVVYLWETDLQDAAGNVYRSGVLKSNSVGATEKTPQGVVYDARQQLLTVSVKQGRLGLLIPERPTDVVMDPASTRIVGSAVWDLSSAAGILKWGAGETRVQDESVHVVGALASVFTGASDGTIRSSWSGQAAEVSAGATPMELKSVSTAQPANDRFLFWGIPLGVALLGAGGGAFLVVHRRHVPRAALPPAAAPTSVSEDQEALLAAAVAKLQSGHAAEVAAELEASFDEKHEAAPFQAYVLALAHLRLQQVEEAADWFLLAARLYPDFAKELPVNDSLKALRGHPRVRGFLEEAARKGGLPPAVRAGLGLVEDSVAYV